MLRKIRLTFAMICFVLITLLFLDFTGTLHGWFGWLAKIQFLPAVLALNVGVILFLVILTLVCGRIYCSVICPLGVFQDILAWLGRQPKKRRKLPYSYSPALSWLRYGVLGVFIIALIAGIGSLAALLAPYSAYGRIANNLFQPIWQWGNNYNPQIQISVVSGTKRSIFRQKNKTKRSKKRLHTTLIKPEQKVNEDLCSGFIVS